MQMMPHMHYGLPWYIFISKTIQICVTRYLDVSFTTYSFEVEETAFKKWTKAVVDGDLGVINVGLQMLILLLTITCSKSSVMV